MPAGKVEKGENIIFPLPGMALNSNEGGTETWRYRQLINTHAHTHAHILPFPSVYLIALLQTVWSTLSIVPLMCSCSDSSSEVGRWIMEDYQSENDSICLNRAERYSAIMPRKEQHFDPWPESSPPRSSLFPWDRTVSSWWSPDEFYSGFKCLHCHFYLV